MSGEDCAKWREECWRLQAELKEQKESLRAEVDRAWNDGFKEGLREGQNRVAQDKH